MEKNNLDSTSSVTRSHKQMGILLDLLKVKNPDTGTVLLAFDIDGVLKKKDEFGVITSIENIGATGPMGRTGRMGYTGNTGATGSYVPVDIMLPLLTNFYFGTEKKRYLKYGSTGWELGRVDYNSESNIGVDTPIFNFNDDGTINGFDLNSFISAMNLQDKNLVVDLTNISDVVVVHNLHKRVDYECFDINGTEVDLDVQYVDDNTVRVRANPNFTGTISFN